MHKKFWVYKIRNIITNKIYIGQTKNIYERLKAHKSCKDKETIIVKSIVKYGWENHEVEVLFSSENITKKEADELEIFYIKKHNSYCKNSILGMNLTEGGYIKSISNESRKKQAKNNHLKWKEKLGKGKSKLIVLDIKGNLLLSFEGTEFKQLMHNISLFENQRIDAVRTAIAKNMWTYTERKYIIGFEDEDIFAKYQELKRKRRGHAKSLPITKKRIDALLNHHKNTHAIPILNLSNGVYFESVQEFCKDQGRTSATIMERFQKGKYSDKYKLCKN